MKRISRDAIQRMVGGISSSSSVISGGGGGGGGVSQYWVDENYVSKEFFNRLFEIHDENGDPILPNDVETEIDNIQAMFGFWTNAYLSALGNNPGGGGVELTLASLADVNVQGVTDGQALVWSAAQGKWVPGEGGGGLDPTAMWAELATSSTQQINKTHLTTALADYLPLAGGTMNSTSLVTNMNADLLDGHHATDFALASAITDMATQTWVSTNYLSKTDAASTYLTKTEANTTYLSIAFFRALFRAYTSGGSEVVPNDGSTSTIDNIKAMFGFWTNSYLSALGSNPGGASLTLSSLSDVSISGATAGQVLTYRNGTWRNETPQGGGLDPTAMWVELATTGTQQINKTHLTTALADYLPLTGGTMANTSVVTNMNADMLDGRHATDFAYGTNGIADSASTLINKTVTSSTLDSLAGSFTFEGNNLTTSGIDEVGIQIGSSVDKFQLVFRDYALMIRQNDSGGTNATDWTKWITLPTKLHTSHQLTKRDQWFRFANLTVYGASYLVSIRDNFYNNAPTPVTWIINVGYDSVTVTQVGRVVLSPTSLTKLRIVRYSNNSDYGFHLEVYTPYQSYISRNTPEINIMNLGRDNMSDGVELVHAINDDTKWLEVSKTIQSGELLLEEVGISDATTLWGQPFDGSSSVSGSLIGVTSIEMNSDGALSGYGGFIDFHYSGSSADYTSRIIENASGRIAINDILYVKTNGTVGIGTDSPSTSYKLDVNGDGRLYNLIIGSDSDNVKGKISPVTFSGTGQGFKLVPDLTNTDVWFAYRRSVTSTSQPMLYLYASIENSGINALQINKADSTTYNFHVGQGFANKTGATTLWGYRIDFKSRLNGTGSSLTHMSITNDGNVGIGTDSPSYKFQVNGQSYFTGNMGIGVAVSGSYALRVNGIVRASTGVYSEGYVTALSDIRHKDIRNNVNLTVTEVANAPAVKFLWKDRRQDGLQVGSIAQYWQKVLPEAIVEAADGELTMSYGVIALLASISNAREIVNLKREIAELKRKLQKHGILE